MIKFIFQVRVMERRMKGDIVALNVWNHALSIRVREILRFAY